MEDHQKGKNEEEKTEVFTNSKKPRNTVTSDNKIALIMAESRNSNGSSPSPSPSSSSSSSSSSSTSPPITRMAQDDLYSILLLLPVRSILCFSMTCTRLQLLTSSDTLWEAICRRDWGNSSVDAFKSSHHHHHQRQRLGWKTLYRQVCKMDAVYCQRVLSLPDADDEVLPSPRASHSLNFVSGCLVLFGGGCDGGRHLDDTWVAYIGNEFRRMLKWQKINAGVPSGRFGHSCVVTGDCLILFGGINDHGVRQNDTWIAQITTHERFGVTLSWRLLNVGSAVPPPRGAHAACSIDNKRMLIHGGIGLSAVRLSDTWILELSENMTSGSWQEIATSPSPESRSGHTLTHIGGSQTILFGGRGLGYEVLNDVWFLDASEGHWRWVQLLFELKNIAHGLALPRVGHSATPILGSRLLIYGGEDSYRHRKDDFWLLDISSIPSGTMQPIALIRKELCTKMWRRLKTEGDKPSSRSFHQTCVDHSGRFLYIFGGMVDGLLHPAETSGLRFDAGLFLVELLLNC